MRPRLVLLTLVAAAFTNLVAVAHADGLGTGLALVPDMDGDGISEWLIGVSSVPVLKEVLGAETPVAKSAQPSVGLVLFSPGKRECIRVIEHGLRLSAGSSPFALLEQKEGESPLVAYLARALDSFDKTYLIVAALDTGEEISRTEFKGIQWGEGGPNLWRLGDVDGKPGDEFLLRRSDTAYDDAIGLTWYKALVVSPGKGVLRGPILGYGIDLVGDVNGDGVADYVATDASCHPIFSGKTGKELFRAIDGDEAHPHYESGIMWHYAAGDCDGDGLGDILQLGVSTSDDFESGSFRDLWARVLSGRTGRSLVDIGRVVQCWKVRANVTVVADQNDDGVEDILIVHGYDGPDEEAWTLFSGKTGEEFTRWRASERGREGQFGMYAVFGYSMIAAGDWDGDGVGDALVSMVGWRDATNDGARVHVFSVGTGKRLAEYGLGALTRRLSEK